MTLDQSQIDKTPAVYCSAKSTDAEIILLFQVKRQAVFELSSCYILPGLSVVFGLFEFLFFWVFCVTLTLPKIVYVV